MQILEDSDVEDVIIEKNLIEEIIEQVPDHQLIVLILINGGFTQSEVATLLGVTRGAVGLKYRRTLLKIEEKLLEEEDADIE